MLIKRQTGAAVLAAAVMTVLPLCGSALASAAPSGHIDHVEAGDGQVQVLFSIDGLPASAVPDLESVAVSLDGVPVDATAVPASGAAGQIGRSAVLVIDSSQSMRGKKFVEAKSAALAFIDQAPPDVQIGIVSFASTVDTVAVPTFDHAALRAAVTGLQLSAQTHLYDGVLAALTSAGTEGQRRLLVLTDGRETTGSALLSVTAAIRKAGDRVDVVGLSVSPADADKLARIAAAGQGSLVNAEDASALTKLFSDEAKALAAQILVSFAVPGDRAGSDASLALSVDADDTSYTDTAFVSLGAAAEEPTSPLPVHRAQGVTVSKPR